MRSLEHCGEQSRPTIPVDVASLIRSGELPWQGAQSRATMLPPAGTGTYSSGALPGAQRGAVELLRVVETRVAADARLASTLTVGELRDIVRDAALEAVAEAAHMRREPGSSAGGQRVLRVARRGGFVLRTAPATTRKPTALQGWALLLVQRTAAHLGRAPEPHEVCAHHRLPPRQGTKLRIAVRGLIRKGLLKPWPILRIRPLRLTASALALCGTLEHSGAGRDVTGGEL